MFANITERSNTLKRSARAMCEAVTRGARRRVKRGTELSDVE